MLFKYLSQVATSHFCTQKSAGQTKLSSSKMQCKAENTCRNGLFKWTLFLLTKSLFGLRVFPSTLSFSTFTPQINWFSLPKTTSGIACPMEFTPDVLQIDCLRTTMSFEALSNTWKQLLVNFFVKKLKQQYQKY